MRVCLDQDSESSFRRVVTGAERRKCIIGQQTAGKQMSGYCHSSAANVDTQRACTASGENGKHLPILSPHGWHGSRSRALHVSGAQASRLWATVAPPVGVFYGHTHTLDPFHRRASHLAISLQSGWRKRVTSQMQHKAASPDSTPGAPDVIRIAA